MPRGLKQRAAPYARRCSGRRRMREGTGSCLGRRSRGRTPRRPPHTPRRALRQWRRRRPRPSLWSQQLRQPRQRHLRRRLRQGLARLRCHSPLRACWAGVVPPQGHPPGLRTLSSGRARSTKPLRMARCRRARASSSAGRRRLSAPPPRQRGGRVHGRPAPATSALHSGPQPGACRPAPPQAATPGLRSRRSATVATALARGVGPRLGLAAGPSGSLPGLQ